MSHREKRRTTETRREKKARASGKAKGKRQKAKGKDSTAVAVVPGALRLCASAPLRLCVVFSLRGWARSAIFMGVPMSSTKISPPSPMAPACMTSWQASGIVMK